MICENCGAKIRKNARYCPDCGMDIISDYKPLQNKYLRGEHLEDEEELLDDDYYSTEEMNNHQEYSEGGNDYQNEEYRTYEATETQGSGLGSIILLLIVALLIGFVMGFIFFSGKLLNIP
jgi:zinc-ribbon domain